MNYRVTIAGREFTVEIADLQARPIRAVVDGEVVEVWPEAAPAAPPTSAPLPVPAKVAGPELPAAPARSLAVLAPIPGVIISVAVQAGAPVEAGQELCVLEAMKMKSPIRAPRAGRLAAVRVAAGQQVKHKEVLMEYEG